MRTRIFIAGGVVAAFLVTVQPAAAATTRLVDDDGAATVANCNAGTGGSAFTTISAAVTAAIAGDTIKVCPGTYGEQVTVNKALTLTGPQAGVDARDPARTGAAGTEAIVRGGVNGANRTTPFNVTINNVTIDGFTVQDETDTNNLGFGIFLGPGTSGHFVRNNVVKNNIAGLSLGSDNTTIERNVFQNNNQPGPISGTAIYTDQFQAGGSVTNVVIDDNAFTANQNVGVLFGSTNAAQGASNVTVSGNTFTDNGNGFLAFNWAGSTFTRNVVTGSLGSQVVLGGGVTNATVDENVITDGKARGIRVGDFGGGGTNSSVSARCNSIAGNAAAGLELDSAPGSYTGTFAAAFNWWGSASGPTIASNPGGTGQTIVDPGTHVAFKPFLTSGVDGDPAAPGFQCVPRVSVADAVVTEGNSGTTLVDVTVTVDVSPNTVTVGFATADGTAVAGADYSNTTGTVTFAPGEQSKTVNVPVVGDTDPEADETFAVMLLNPSNATIGDGQGVVTITNDDADTTAPRASRLRLSSFRRRKGTTVRYRLSEAATTTFTVQRRVKGRKFKRVRGSFKHQGKAGANSFKFRGRVGGRRLRPGSYRLNAVPADAAGNVGRRARALFKVKR